MVETETNKETTTQKDQEENEHAGVEYKADRNSF